MQNLAERDYFTDYSILKDPYEYFEALRSKGPVHELPGRDVVVVTGFAEALDVLRNNKDFSSAISVQGAAAPLPFAPAGDDLTPQIEMHRAELPGGTFLVAYDDAKHLNSRSILARLFTPSRLKANEEFMSAYADKLVKDAVATGGCELIKEIATPFVTLVIADLLGVPEDDRELFMSEIATAPPPGNMDDAEAKDRKPGPMEFMAKYFAQYVADRRANPRNDVLTELSLAKYPDGSTPDLMDRAPCHFSIRRRAGHQREAPRQRDALPRRCAGVAGQTAPGAEADPAVSGRSPSPRRVDENHVPPGKAKYTHRRPGDSGGQADSDRLRCGEPGSASMGGAAGIPTQPAQNQ
jgi:hypothetical protein